MAAANSTKMSAHTKKYMNPPPHLSSPMSRHSSHPLPRVTFLFSLFVSLSLLLLSYSATLQQVAAQAVSSSTGPDGSSSTGPSIVVPTPVINSVNPPFGVNGTTVTLTGANFNQSMIIRYQFAAWNSVSPSVNSPFMDCAKTNVINSTLATCYPSSDPPAGQQSYFSVFRYTPDMSTLLAQSAVSANTHSVLPFIFNSSVVISIPSVQKSTPFIITFSASTPRNRYTIDIISNPFITGNAANKYGIGFTDNDTRTAFYPCETLTYVQNDNFTCSIGTTMNIASRLIPVYRHASMITPLPQSAIQYGFNTANAAYSILTVYDLFKQVYQSQSTNAYSSAVWSGFTTGSSNRAWRMSIPAAAISGSGWGLVLRFIAPNDTLDYIPKTGQLSYSFTQVSIGYKASGNAALLNDGSTTKIPNMFPSTYMQATFLNLPYTSTITATGVQYIDSAPIFVNNFCLKQNSDVPYDLIVTLKRTSAFSPELLQTPALNPVATYSADASGGNNAFDRAYWDSASIGQTAVGGSTRVSVGLHSMFVTQQDDYNANPNCAIPLITSITPSYIFENATVTLVGANFNANQQIMYTTGLATDVPNLYTTLQFTSPSNCTRVQYYFDPNFGPTLTCQVGGDIPIGNVVYFVVYSGSQLSKPFTLTPVRAYPNILNQMIVSQPSGAINTPYTVNVTLSAPTFPENNYNNFGLFNFTLGWINPNTQAFTVCDATNWVDTVNSKMSCTFTPPVVGNYQFMAQGMNFPYTYVSLGTGPAANFTAYPIFTTIYNATVATQNVLNATWIPISVFNDETYRFSIPIYNFSTFKTNSIVLRLFPFDQYPAYFINYVSINWGFANNPNTYPVSEQQVTWGGNPTGSDWSVGAFIQPNQYHDSQPINFCFNTIDPTVYDITITLHVSVAMSTSLAARQSSFNLVPTTFVNTYGVNDIAVTGGVNVAAKQFNWNGYNTGGAAIASNQNAVLAIESIHAVSTSSCPTRPTINNVYPNQTAPNFAFRITVYGTNFGSSALPVPQVFYDATTKGVNVVTGFSSSCTNVIRVSTTQLTCMIGTDVAPGASVRFQVAVQASTGGPYTLSQANNSVQLNTTLAVMDNIALNPMSGAVGVQVATINITFTTSNTTFILANFLGIGIFDPLTNITTPCTPGTTESRATTLFQFMCTKFTPTRAGAYLMAAILPSGVNVLSTLATGGAFTAYPTFDLVYSTTQTYVGGFWGSTSSPLPRTSRTVLPASAFTGSGTNLVMRMYGGRGNNASSITFNSVSLSVGIEYQPGGTNIVNPFSADAFTPYLIPVTFYGVPWSSNVTILQDNFRDSNPIPICINQGGSTQLDLIYTINRAGGWSYETTSISRAASTFTLAEYPPFRALQPQWDNFTSTQQRNVIDISEMYATANPTVNSMGSTNTNCDRPIITSIVLGTTLPQQPLLITLVGNNFNNGSAQMIQSSINSQGIITAIQVSYYVLGNTTNALRYTYPVNNIDFKYGNATLCTGLTIVSKTALVCTLPTLTIADMGANVTLQVFQFGQLSAPFSWNVSAPFKVDVFAGATVFPQNGPTIPVYNNITGLDPSVNTVLLTVTLSKSFTYTTWDFQSSAVMGYTDPNGVWHACYNVTYTYPSLATCGIRPEIVGNYAVQATFYNGYNSSTILNLNGLYRAWANFAPISTNDGQFFSNTRSNFGTANGWTIQSSLPGEPTTFRFTLPAYNFVNTSAIILRLFCPASMAGYTVNQVTIGLGKAGLEDVYPTTLVPVVFNNLTLIPGVADSAQSSWTASTSVASGFYLDSTPIPFCIFGNYDLVVTVHYQSSVSSGGIPAIISTFGQTTDQATYYLPDSSALGFSGPLSPNWAGAKTFLTQNGNLGIQQDFNRAGYMVDSVNALNNVVCPIPTITGIYPANGPGSTAITVTLTGSGFNSSFLLNTASNANPMGWVVQYGINDPSNGNSYPPSVTPTVTQLPANTGMCTNVRVISDSMLTCLTGTDIPYVSGGTTQAEFIIANSNHNQLLGTFLSSKSTALFTTQLPVFTDVYISPQNIPSFVAGQVLTVIVSDAITSKSDFTSAVLGVANAANTALSYPCASVNWGTSTDTFTCVLPALPAGSYWLQATFGGAISPTNPSNYVVYSSFASSTTFFAALNSTRDYFNASGNSLAASAPGTTFSFSTTGIDPGVFPVTNSRPFSASYRFSLPQMVYTSPTSVLYIRMPAAPADYQFTGLTIALGVRNSSVPMDVFNASIQVVTFGSAKNYPSNWNGTNKFDTPITVRAGTTLDSNPIFMCLSNATSQLYNVFITIHGVLGVALPGLGVSPQFGPLQSAYQYNDQSGVAPYGTSSSQWSNAPSGVVSALPDFAAIGVLTVTGYNISSMPAYYRDGGFGMPMSGNGSCSALPSISNVQPSFIFPVTYSIVTINGNNFVPSVQVYYGTFFGFGPVPVTTSTPLPSFMSNSCVNLTIINSKQLTCYVGTNIYRGQSVQFLVTNQWMISNPSPLLPTQINFILQSVIPFNGNAFVHPALDNPFSVSPLFNPLNLQTTLDQMNAGLPFIMYTINVPYGIRALNMSVRTQKPNAAAYWMIGASASSTSATLFQAIADFKSRNGNGGPGTGGNPLFPFIAVPAVNSSFMYTPISVGNNYLQMWNLVDDLNYTFCIIKAVPDITSLVVSPFPLSASFNSTFSPSTYVPQVNSYIITVPFITTNVSLTISFGVIASVVVDLSGRNQQLAVSGSTYVFGLSVGSNFLNVGSARDGNYTFTIIRNPPDTNFISVGGLDVYAAAQNFDSKLNPAFKPTGVTPLYYQFSVPYVKNRITFTSTFATAGTTNVSKIIGASDYDYYMNTGVYARYAIPAVLQTGVASRAYNLTVGRNMFTVNSTLDGMYVFFIDRQPPQVQGMIITGLNLVATNVDMNLNAFIPGVFSQYQYGFNFGRAIDSINVTLFFTGTSVNTISMNLNNNVSSTVPDPSIDQTQPNANIIYYNQTIHVPTSLLVGLNYLYITSLLDGTYVIPITRLASDFNGLSIAGYSPTAVPTAVMNPVIRPSFNPGNNSISYALSVNYTVWTLSFNVSFVSLGTITITNDYLAQVRDKTQVQSNQFIAPLQLRTASQGVNKVVVTSQVEGSYTFLVTRNEPDITSFSLNQLLIPGARMLFALNSNTPFQSQIYSYNLTVYYGSNILNPAITFTTLGTLVMDLNGQSFQSPRFNQNPQQIIGIYSYNLTVGVNVFHVVSQLDGAYTFNINRLPPDLVSMSLRAETVNGTLMAVNLFPTFQPGLRDYYLTVSYKFQAMQFLFNFSAQPVNINSLKTVSYNEAGGRQVTSGVWTDSLPMDAQDPTVNATTYFKFQVHSDADLDYSLNVQRSPNNIQRILLFANQGVNYIESYLDQNVLSSGGVAFTPPFKAGTYYYDVDLPYIVSTVTFQVYTAINGDNITIENFDAGIKGFVRLPVTNANKLGPFNLYVDVLNTFRIYSSLDGDFTINVRRRAPDLKNVIVSGTSPISPLLPNWPVRSPTSFDRPFTPPTVGYVTISQDATQNALNYSIFVNYKINNALFVVNYTDVNDVVTVANNATLLSSTLLNGNILTAPSFPLTVGGNMFVLSPNLDGVYTIYITRSSPDLVNLTLATYNASQGLVSAYVPLYTYDYGVGPQRSPLLLSPLNFTAGLTLYTAFVPYSQQYIQLTQLGFTNADNITLDVNFNNTNYNYTNSETLVRSYNRRFKVASIPDSMLYPLFAGATMPNTIRVNSSIDGTYLFTIYRGNGTLTLFNTQPKIQSNFSTSYVDPNNNAMYAGLGIGLQFGGGLYKPDITVQITCTNGTVTPSSIPFTQAMYTQTSFFHYKAPVVLSDFPIRINFQLTGLDAWQIDPIPPIDMTVFPVNVTTIGSLDLLPQTMPQSVLVNSTTPLITILPSALRGRPLINNSLILTMLPSAGYTIPANLTFTYDNWLQNQTFALVAPAFATNLSIDFSLASANGLTNANNWQQYAFPRNNSYIIQVLALVSVGNSLFPATLYNNQRSAAIPLTVNGVYATNVYVTISSPSTAMFFNASTIYYTAAMPGSSQFFTIQPLFGNLKVSTVVYVSFTIGGGDAMNYAPVPLYAITIKPQAFLTISDVPAFLYVGLSMGTRYISITPSEAPNGNLRVVPAAPGVQGTLTLSPTQVTVPSGQVAPVKFQLLAPTIPQLLTLSFSLTFDDVAHFIPPAPITIPILAQSFINVLNVPTYIWSNQVVSNMIIQPNVILTLDQFGAGVSVSVFPSLGAISPSSTYNFGAGAPQTTATFSLTPPTNYVGPITLSYSIGGADRDIYTSIATQTITVLSQGSWQITGMPVYGIASGSMLTISIQPLATPTNNADVSLTLSVDQGASIVGSSTLVFTSQSTQSFTIKAPSAPTTVTLSWAVSGTQAAQFAQPSQVQVVVLASIVLSNKPVQLYANQVSDSLTVTPQQPSLSAPITLFTAYMNVLITPSSAGAVATANPVAFPTPVAQYFTVTAPPTVPASGIISLNFAMAGVAAQYFAPPTSIDIIILPQATVALQGVLTLYAYDSTMLTLMPSAPVEKTTTFTFSLGTFPGTIVPSTVTLPAGYSVSTAALMGFVQITYFAPAFATAAQTIIISSTVSGSGAAQFSAPTLKLDMRGVMTLSICNGATSVYVSGVLNDNGDWNGVYTANIPVNGKPHYQLKSASTGNLYHLFYFVDPSKVYPSVWMIDRDYSIYASHFTAFLNFDTTAPFSAGWTYGQRAGSVGSALPTINVICGVDCSTLGTSSSLETQICYGGTSLLSTPIPSMPNYCPLSCAKYLPNIYSSCGQTPFFLNTANNMVSYGVNYMLSQCTSCNNTMITNMINVCGMTLTGSDVTQDLLSVIQPPSTGCSSACSPAYINFYSTCASKQPVIPYALSNFYARCLPTVPPNAVSTINLVEARADSLAISWPIAVQVQYNPIPVTYFIEVANYPYLTLNSFDLGFSVIANRSENAFTLWNLNVNMTYSFRITAVTSAGASPVSAVYKFATILAAPPAPVGIYIDVLVTQLPQTPSLPITYSTNIYWNASLTSLMPGDTQYRVTVMQALDDRFLLFGPEQILYVGFGLKTSFQFFLPGNLYTLTVTAQRFRNATATSPAGPISQFGAETYLNLLIDNSLPNRPDFTSATSVSSASVTLNWNNINYCGARNCSGVFYEIQFFNNGITSQLNGLSSPLTSSASTGTGGSITGRWVSLFNVTYPTTYQQSLTSIWNGAAAGCDYYFRIRAWNSRGASDFGSNLFVQTPGTLPSVVRTAVFSVTSYSSIQALWNNTAIFYSDGFSQVNMVHFYAVPQSGSTTNVGGIDFFVAIGSLQASPAKNPQGYAYSYTLTGLTPGIVYQVVWEVRNNIGWSGLSRSAISFLSMPDIPPRLISLQARDPSLNATAFSQGNIMVATFDKPTNKPDLSTKDKLDAFFQWSSVIPATYSGIWSSDATVLSIVIGSTYANALTTSPVVGVFSALVIGDLYNALLTSTSLKYDDAVYRRQTLLGTWASRTVNRLLSATTVTYIQGESKLNPIVPLVSPASDSLPYTRDAIMLNFVVSNGVIVYPYNAAVGLLSGVSQASFTINNQVYANLISTNASINPFLQIAYTPTAGFYGSDVLQITMTGVFGPEQVSIPIRVLQVNRPPTVTVPATPKGFDPFGANSAYGYGTPLTSTFVNDVDDIGTTQISVTLSSPSTTAWFAYYVAPPGDVSLSTSVVGQQSNVLTVSGAYSFVVPFLPLIHWFDPMLDPDSAALPYVNVRANDLGSGITGAAPMYGDARYQLQPICSATNVPYITSIRFSADLSSILITFDARIKLVLPAAISSSQSASTSCTLFLDAPSMLLIGNLASTSCYVSNPTTLLVQLGQGFTAKVGSTFSLSSTATTIRRCLSSPDSASARGSMTIAPSLQTILPVAYILGPPTIGICQDLTLTSTLVNVTGPVSFVWSVTPDLDDILPQTLNSNSSNLVIPTSNLRAGTTYTFSLQVLNIVGSSSLPTSLRVTKDTRPNPALVPTTATLISLRTTDTVTLSALGNFSSCIVSQVTPALQTLQFAWSVSPNTIALDSNSKSTSTLLVRGSTLQASSTYTFTLLATVLGDPTLKATLNYTIIVLPSVSTVVPSTASQLLPLNSSITLTPTSLTATSVVAPTSTSLIWTCVTSSGSSCFNALTQQPLAAVTVAAGASLSLPAGTLGPDTYIFTAQTIPAGYGQAVTVASTVAVTVSVSAAPPVVSIKASSVRVATNDPLIISSSILSAAGIALNMSDPSYQFQWSMAPNSSSWSGLNDPTISVGVNTPVLQINRDGTKSVFPKGSRLRFRLTVTDTRVSQYGFAELDVDVTSPPSGGSFLVNPRWGYAGSTVYSVVASDWTGSSVLSYKYFTVNPNDGTLIAFGGQPGSPIDSDLILFAAPSSTNYTMNLLLRISDLSGSTITLATNITVMPAPIASASTNRAAQIAITNALQVRLQSLMAAGSTTQLLATITASSVASQLTLLPTVVSNTTTPQYMASYSRCYSQIITTATTWSPTISTADSTGLSVSTLVARSTLLLSALSSSINSATIQDQVSACLSMANDPAISATFSAASSLVSLCTPVLTNAIAASKTLCSATTVGCYGSQQTLLNTSLSASASLLQCYLAGVNSATVSSTLPLSSTNRRLLASSDAPAIAPIIQSIFAIYDRVTISMMQVAGQSFINNDCQIPSIISRDNPAQPWSYSFSDGSSVSYAAKWSSAAVADTRAIYHMQNPIIYASTSATPMTQVSGVIMTERTDETATILYTSVTASFSASVTLKYNVATCNSTCTPVCLLWNPAGQYWGSYYGAFNVTTRFPSINGQAGYVDCLSNGVTTMMVAAFNAPGLALNVIRPPATSSSTGSNGNAGTSGASGNNGGGSTTAGAGNSGGTTGASGSNNGGTAGSTGGSGTLGGYGLLGGPPPSVNLLPSPSTQLWGINATMVLALDTFFLQDSQIGRLRSGLINDLATVMGIAAIRIEISYLVAGSIIAGLLIEPSSNSADTTPDVAWRRLQGQIGVPGSAFVSGDVTAAYDHMAFTSYIPSTMCPDGYYHVTCPVVSSTGISSSTGMGSSTGVAFSSTAAPITLDPGNSGSSSAFLGGGRDLLIFILVVSIGGFLVCCLMCCLMYYCVYRVAPAKKDDTTSESDNLAFHKSSASNSGGGSGSGSKVNPTSAKGSPSPSASQVAIHMDPSPQLTGHGGFTAQVQSAPFFNGASPQNQLSPSEELALARGAPMPPVLQLEKGNSPSTETTPTNSPRVSRPVLMTDVHMHLPQGFSDPDATAQRRGSARLATLMNPAPRAGVKRFTKLNANMIAEASGMLMSPSADPSQQSAPYPGSTVLNVNE